MLHPRNVVDLRKHLYYLVLVHNLQFFFMHVCVRGIYIVRMFHISNYTANAVLTNKDWCIIQDLLTIENVMVSLCQFVTLSIVLVLLSVFCPQVVLVKQDVILLHCPDVCVVYQNGVREQSK